MSSSSAPSSTGFSQSSTPKRPPQRRNQHLCLADFQDGWIEEGDRTKKKRTLGQAIFYFYFSNFNFPTYPSASSASRTVAYDLINVPTCVISISAFTCVFIPATANFRCVR